MTRTFEDKPAVREETPLIVGAVGPSGTGKTYSLLRLGMGICRVTGGELYVVDTEGRRALHYADKFKFRHVSMGAPFSPADYKLAIQHCLKKAEPSGKKPTILVDSMSHEHEGPGGVLEWHEKELDRMAGQDQGKRNRQTFAAWAKPKAAAEKIVANLKDRGITLDGESEVAILWTEQTEHGPVECRCMFDHVWMGGGSARILDLKVTANAAPTFVERNAENMGYAIQEAAYRRALVALEPNLSGRADFLFAFAENDDPFALNLSRGDGLFRDLGEQRWQRALNTWALCMKEQKWPSYGTGINPLSAPAWAFHREEQAQMASEESAA
jgi:hypothetical protein